MWLKGFHLFFMTAWFAGLFYLPRIFVNHAERTDNATSERFKLKERKHYRFITPWMILTIVFGIWMLHDYAWAVWGHMLWLHIKLVLIIGLVGYHFWCGRIVKTFAEDQNRRSHVWYRWFNEIPVLFLLAIVYLASVKPF
jgi:putative membrane protein